MCGAIYWGRAWRTEQVFGNAATISLRFGNTGYKVRSDTGPVNRIKSPLRSDASRQCCTDFILSGIPTQYSSTFLRACAHSLSGSKIHFCHTLYTFNNNYDEIQRSGLLAVINVLQNLILILKSTILGPNANKQNI